MIYQNTDEDKAIIQSLFEALQLESTKHDVVLEWVEIKGTIFFKPMLIDEDDE